MNSPWSSAPPVTGLVRPGDVVIPMPLLPPLCCCVWTVHRPGTGMACLMRLRYVNRACFARHERLAVMNGEK